jgi:hypothetical protein
MSSARMGGFYHCRQLVGQKHIVINIYFYVFHKKDQADFYLSPAFPGVPPMPDHALNF